MQKVAPSASSKYRASGGNTGRRRLEDPGYLSEKAFLFGLFDIELYDVVRRRVRDEQCLSVMMSKTETSVDDLFYPYLRFG